ncbi:hypothetical protein AWW66_30455 [Micromonospora rosaria]|uniref:Serpin domain-containing protein n=1 Tax=Micromonospora rosaria TaxID=47874 RepID=A0A136PIU5_9ACTN|nr:hypothetical protein AWW66_30455 [Micromonospora rosaria]
MGQPHGSDAANTLTARWAATLDGRSTVLSGAGVHPLLALLAPHAAGATREELLSVVGDPGAGVDLTGSPGATLAVSAWTAAGLPLTERWLAAVPEPVRQRLTGDPAADQRALDGWAAARTDGVIPRVPVRVTRADLLVLVSALLVRTTWAQPFTERRFTPAADPWRGHDLPGLYQSTGDVGRLRVVSTSAGPVTLLTVPGTDDVDVLLVLGTPQRPAREVLPAAIGARAGGTALPVTAGPGVSTRTVLSPSPAPELHVWTVPFDVDAEHDLLAHADLFGLRAATDPRTGHFPGISPLPLAVSQARQSATATFTATGFTAAAVTALSMRFGSAPPRATAPKEIVHLEITPPFGFLAVHRPTGLVLFAGWVTEPAPPAS